MQTIPLAAVPNQTLQVQLGEQPCTLDVRQTSFGLFINVTVNQTRIVAGVICQNLNPIVRSTYLGFVGDLVFYDTQGTDNPVYTGLGSRFLLMYVETTDAADVAAAEAAA